MPGASGVLRGLGYPRFDSRLQQLIYLCFVACSKRQTGTRSDDEPSKENDRSALRQRDVLPHVEEEK